MSDFIIENYGIVIFWGISLSLLLIYLRRKKARDKIKLLVDEYLSKSVMSKTEFEVYRNILSVLPSQYYLLAQVRLCDLLQVNTKHYKPRTSKWYSLFNKISRWHCDFVIIDNAGKTVCCMELDDHTHRNEKRINRDIEFNKIFKQAEITLLRGDQNQLIELIKTHFFE